MSRPRTRLRILEELFAADRARARACCIADPATSTAYVDALLGHLDTAELPTAPPVVLSCRKAADAAPCAEGRECAARVWSRFRRLAVITADLDETEL